MASVGSPSCTKLLESEDNKTVASSNNEKPVAGSNVERAAADF